MFRTKVYTLRLLQALIFLIVGWQIFLLTPALLYLQNPSLITPAAGLMLSFKLPLIMLLLTVAWLTGKYIKRHQERQLKKESTTQDVTAVRRKGK